MTNKKPTADTEAERRMDLIKSEIRRLQAWTCWAERYALPALKDADETIHDEFCGSSCHKVHKPVSDALAAIPKSN